jgi:hypothetical protein
MAFAVQILGLRRSPRDSLREVLARFPQNKFQWFESFSLVNWVFKLRAQGM